MESFVVNKPPCVPHVQGLSLHQSRCLTGRIVLSLDKKFPLLRIGHFAIFRFVHNERVLVALLRKAGFNSIHFDTYFGRSSHERGVRWLRHAALCLAAFPSTTPMLGRHELKMWQEAK